jgi:hypothetical protein
MNPLIDEMTLRQRHDDLLRQAAHERLVQGLKAARRDRPGAIRSIISQTAAILAQRLKAQLRLSSLKYE